jgi:hypothetical protein
MATYEEFQAALKIVNEYKLQTERLYKDVVQKVDNISKYANVEADTKINDIGLTSHLKYSLINYNYLYNTVHWLDAKVSDLSEISISKFTKQRNVGNARVKELLELCFYAGIKLKP